MSMYSHSPGGSSAGPGVESVVLLVDAVRFDDKYLEVEARYKYAETKLQQLMSASLSRTKRRRLRVCSCYTDLHCVTFSNNFKFLRTFCHILQILVSHA